MNEQGYYQKNIMIVDDDHDIVYSLESCLKVTDFRSLPLITAEIASLNLKKASRESSSWTL